MSLDYIRDYYRVPARRGGRIEYSGVTPPVRGTISGADGQYLSVRMDGVKHASSFHPTWKMRYLDQEANTDAT